MWGSPTAERDTASRCPFLPAARAVQRVSGGVPEGTQRSTDRPGDAPLMRAGPVRAVLVPNQGRRRTGAGGRDTDKPARSGRVVGFLWAPSGLGFLLRRSQIWGGTRAFGRKKQERVTRWSYAARDQSSGAGKPCFDLGAQGGFCDIERGDRGAPAPQTGAFGKLREKSIREAIRVGPWWLPEGASRTFFQRHNRTRFRTTLERRVGG